MSQALDLAEQIDRVLRSNEETQKLVAEQKKLMAEAARLDRPLTHRQIGLIVAASFAATAALIGATAAVTKLYFLP